MPFQHGTSRGAVGGRVRCDIGINEKLTTCIDTEYIVDDGLGGSFGAHEAAQCQCLEGQGFEYSADKIGISSRGIVPLNYMLIVNMHKLDRWRVRLPNMRSPEIPDRIMVTLVVGRRGLGAQGNNSR